MNETLGRVRRHLLLQIALRVGMVLCLCLVAHMAYRWVALRAEIASSQEERIQLVSSRLAEALARPLYEGSQAAVLDMVRAFGSGNEPWRVVVVDTAGAVVASGGHDDAHGGQGIAATQHILYRSQRDGRIPVGAVVVTQGGQVGEEHLRRALVGELRGHVLLGVAILLLSIVMLRRLGQAPLVGDDDSNPGMAIPMAEPFHPVPDVAIKAMSGSNAASAVAATAGSGANGQSAVGKYGLAATAVRALEAGDSQEETEWNITGEQMTVPHQGGQDSRPLEAEVAVGEIIAWVDLCLSTELDTRQRNCLARIRSAAVALAGSNEKMVSGVGRESKTTGEERLFFDLDGVVAGVAAMLSPQAGNKGLELVTDVDPDLPPSLIGDPVRLGQVLGNLVSNAIRFSRQGDVLLAVREESRQGSSIRLRFSVRDQGTGLAPEQQARLFDASGPFPAGAVWSHSNTRLGLAVCRRLVELMGGELGVESRYGEGSCFHFTAVFDVREPPGDRIRPYAEQVRAFSGRRVMVVDDNAHSREVARMLLGKLGFVPDVFASGKEVIDRLRSRDSTDYLFCLIDSVLPDHAGVDVARRMRLHYGRGCPPLLLLAPSSHAREVQRSAADFAGVISKPFNVEQVFKQLTAILCPARPVNLVQQICNEWNLAARLQGKSVVVADHNEVSRELIVGLLRDVKMRVQVVCNGLEALQAVREAPPDCILMDCQIPVMDGFEATAKLRALGFTQLPIIALGPNATDKDHTTCLAAGMNDYISKPVALSDLLRVLAKCVGTTRRKSDAGNGERDEAFLSPDTRGETLPPLPPGLDVQCGLRRLRGKTALFLKALRMFRDSRGHQFQLDFRAAVAAGDWQTSERLAHSLKSTAATIGANDLSAAAASLEAAIRAGNYSEVQGLFSEVTAKLRAIVDGLAHIG